MEPWIIARAVGALVAIGLLLALLRLALARFGGGSVGRAARGERLVEVLDVAALPYESAVAVVRVEGRRVVVAVGRGAVAVVASAPE